MGPLRPSLPPMLLAAWPVPSRPVLPCLGPPRLAVLTAPPGSLCPSHGGASPDPTIGSYGCPYRSRPPPREAAEAHTRMWCPEERALRPQPAFCWSRAALLRRLVPVFPALPQPVPAAWVASHGPQCSVLCARQGHSCLGVSRPGLQLLPGSCPVPPQLRQCGRRSPPPGSLPASLPCPGDTSHGHSGLAPWRVSGLEREPFTTRL